MIKIIHNKLIIDLCKEERYLKYLPQSNHYIEVKRYMANAVLGSDGNTIYHLMGTPYTFQDEVKTVEIYNISQEEYDKLQIIGTLQNSQETLNLKKEVDDLKVLVTQQNALIQQLLQKLS